MKYKYKFGDWILNMINEQRYGKLSWNIDDKKSIWNSKIMKKQKYGGQNIIRIGRINIKKLCKCQKR